MNTCLFEDTGVGNLEPLTLTRPAFELWCGAGPLWQRQLNYFGSTRAYALVRPNLADLCRNMHSDWLVNDLSTLGEDPVTLVNARWLAPAAKTPDLHTPHLGMLDGKVAYVLLSSFESTDSFPDDLAWRSTTWQQTLPVREAGGKWIDFPWDLIAHNPDALMEDADNWSRHRPLAEVPQGVIVVGPRENLKIDPTAKLEPMVVVDTTRGPVMVDRNATVQAFSRLEGPCYVGVESQILAGRLRGGTLGPQCRIGGEVEASIVQGFSNKYHDGFLGHSYVGEWVNFGAGTQVSDLRNDYGSVKIAIGGRFVDTGHAKVGAIVGDHARTSVGTLFNTGSVIGPFAQLLASGTFLPRLVPSFCQASPSGLRERNDLKQMVATAAIVMARRGQQWTEFHEELFYGLYEQTSADRKRALRDSEQRRVRKVVS